jgi:uncharacterized protein (DUF697 family)
MYTDAELVTKRREAGLVIHAFAVAHGAVAFLLANTALMDGPILAGMTMWMIHRLGKIFDKGDVNTAQIFWNIFQYVAGSWLTAKALFFIPGIGNWANAGTTMLLTETIGWACIFIFSGDMDPEKLTKQEWKNIAKMAKREGKKHNQENKEVLNKASDEEKKQLKSIVDQLKDEHIPEQDKEKLLSELADLYEKIKQG